MKRKQIPWKKNNISLMIKGVTILATVTWWSKEYYIEIIEPFPAKITGVRMMYAVPCKFVFTNPEKSSEVSIYETCVEKIRDYFQKNCKITAN